MKTPIVLYDVHATDQEFYQHAFGPDVEVGITAEGLTPDTAALAAKAQVIAVHVTSAVTAALMERMPALKHVACRSTGFDHVDLAYTKKHGITVSTVPIYGEDTVAEYTFMLLLAISRRLMPAANSVRTGVVTPEQLTGHDLNGKTLGVVGTGRIGLSVAQIGRGFGMTVVAYDPFPNEKAAKDIGFEYLTLNQLLARADCLTLHAPATPETHHLLGKAAFAKVKPGVFIVNTARGSLIDTPALVEALENGTVAAAGLDVLEGEEFLQIGPQMQLLSVNQLDDEKSREKRNLDLLLSMPNVLITTHNAYNSAEALGRIRDTSVANIKAALAGSPQNPPR